MDEVEARWAVFAAQHPKVEMLEVDWGSKAELSAGIASTAAFMSRQVEPAMQVGVNSKEATLVRHHNTHGRRKSDAKYSGLQQSYLKIMGYTARKLALIKKVLDYDDLGAT